MNILLFQKLKSILNHSKPHKSKNNMLNNHQFRINVAYRNLFSTDRGFCQMNESWTDCFEAYFKFFKLRMVFDMDGSSIRNLPQNDETSNCESREIN